MAIPHRRNPSGDSAREPFWDSALALLGISPLSFSIPCRCGGAAETSSRIPRRAKQKPQKGQYGDTSRTKSFWGFCSRVLLGFCPWPSGDSASAPFHPLASAARFPEDQEHNSQKGGAETPEGQEWHDLTGGILLGILPASPSGILFLPFWGFRLCPFLVSCCVGIPRTPGA